jgi:hypothetical protein
METERIFFTEITQKDDEDKLPKAPVCGFSSKNRVRNLKKNHADLE